MDLKVDETGHKGMCVPGTLKVDHLQPVELILIHKCSAFLTFILGAPISYYPRERKEGSSRGW